ncbi:MAG: tripartite tricarboxylate transporter substrate-binding protein [Proteobacteria bacterium]|nr:tripartite tricarboxylate transporter substrate-binding protein [Pseudomonadota bacterium]
MIGHIHIKTAVFVIAMALAPVGAAAADPVADFYTGKTVKFIVGGSAAGGFTLLARVVGRNRGKYVPGSPTMIVDAMPGAGGATMMAYMANAALQDGTVLGAALPIAVNAPLLRKVKYNPAKFHWLGSVTAMTEVSSVWHTAPATTLDGAKKVEVIMATSSKLSSAYIIPAFMNAVIGTKFKIVPGYRGGGPMNKAMETGEVHGRGSFYNSYVTTKPHWLRDRKIIHLVQVGPGEKDLADVPNMRDLVTNDDQRRMLDFLEAPAYVGHGFFTPPGVPADRVAALKKAFVTTLKDPAFLAETKQRLMIVNPVSAEKITSVINRAMATPEPLLVKFRQMVKIGPPKAGKKKK